MHASCGTGLPGFKHEYGSATYYLCDLGQGTQDFHASVSLSAKWA